MELQTAKIISGPTRDCWSQVHIFSSKEPFKKKNYGDLLAVIKIKIAEPIEGAELASLGKEIISRLHEEYYSSEKEGILEKLENSLKKIREEFGDFGLGIVVGVVWPEALYLGILNEGKAVLLREGSLVTILENGKGLITTSGLLKENDLFVLGTARFFELVTKEIIKANLENKEPEEAAEALTPVIHESGKDGRAAAVIAKVGLAERQEEQEKGKLFSRFKGLLSELSSRAGPIYVPRRKEGQERKQRMMLTIAVTFVILLLISIVFGFFKKRREGEVKSFNQFWEEIEYKYEEGKKLVELNPRMSRELLGNSLELTQEKKDDYPVKSWQYKRLEEREKEIEGELEKVLREYEIAEVPVFWDLSLVKKDLRGIGLYFWEEKLVVLGEDGTVITVDLNKKKETLGKVEGGKLVSLWGGKVFVLGEKIVAVGNKTEIEKEWGEIVGFKVFAGNLYLLDKGESKIWKYPAIEDGFGSKRNWLGPAVEPDLTEVVDMAIDGDVWVLARTGEILKFNRGAPKAFGLSGLDQEFNQPSAFYTDEDCQKIYVLDKGNQRVVALHKSGEYDSQYLWEETKEVDDLVVSEKERKILLLSGEKIYEIELR